MFPYYIHSSIGSGSFSKVWKGAKTSNPSQPVAIKLIPLKHETHGSQELTCLRIIPLHPNILSILDTPCYISFQDEAYMASIFQYCPGGDMFNYLQTNGRMTEKLACMYFHQLLSALQTAHKVRIYHRDIKLENIMIGPDGELKLGDWGMAARIEEDIVQSVFMGSPMYMAPELFTPQPYSPAMADTWAAVCVSFMLYTAHPPFHRPFTTDWYYKSLHGDQKKYWATFTSYSISDSFQQMVQNMFVSKPANRPTINHLLKCSWVVDNNDWPTE